MENIIEIDILLIDAARTTLSGESKEDEESEVEQLESEESL